MRIAAIGPLDVPSLQGGMSRHCEELYPRLVRRGHAVTLFCRTGEDFGGVRVRTLPLSDRRGVERLQHALYASARAIAEDFDVVHYHALVNTAFAFLPRLRARRTLVTVHRLEWQDEKWGAAGRATLRASEWMAMHSAHAVIAVSRVLAHDLAGRYRRARVHYVPNGVRTLPEPDPDALRRLGLAAGRYVLFVGRIVPEKGVDVLVDAFAQLRPTFADVDLAIVGAPRHSEAFAAALRARAPDGVRFCGTQPGEVLAALYAGASAFVTPSLREGLPLNVLEAMSAGCCVVASDIPEHREVLERTGVLVPESDAKALADALHDVLKDAELASTLGRAAKARIGEGEYDWERVADRTDEIIHGL